MIIEVVMRRPQSSEYNSVRALIETVANETFKDLFAPNPVPLKFEDEDWPLAWVAVSDEKIVGVIITNQEWVSDLWVFREHRRQGVGSRLLAQGEAEIAARGHQTCRLRVVRSNAVAVQFYLSQGWQIAREFAHEKYHLYLYVENVDKAVAKAVGLGATTQGQVMDMFWGDRCGMVVDPDGYGWMVGTHKAEPTTKEMKKKMAEQVEQQAAGAPTVAA